MPASLSLLCRLPLCVGLAVASLYGQDGYDSGGSPLQLVKRLGLGQGTPPERIGTWLRIRGMATAPVWPVAGGRTERGSAQMVNPQDWPRSEAERDGARQREDGRAGRSARHISGGWRSRVPLGQATEQRKAGAPGARDKQADGQRDTGGDIAPSSVLRSSGSPASAALTAEIERMREALGRVRAAGYRSACMLRWERVWASGARAGGSLGNRAPLDLREAYARAYALAATYGDLVDAWEFENEPDIPFFADNADVFTAYYKAVALGIAQGRERAWARVGEKSDRAVGEKNDRGQSDRRTEDRATDAARQRGELSERAAEAGVTPSADLMICRSVGPSVCRSIHLLAGSRIVMPALAPPPGPYLEQLLANGFLSYTEGANLHYYGFAEDYADAHARLREALSGAVATPVPGVGLGRIGRTPDTGVATRGARTAGPENARHGRDDTNSRSGVATPVPGVGLGADGAGSRREPRFFKVRPPSAGRPVSVHGLSGTPVLRPPASPRRLPVFVTEWGYPRLDGYAAQTVEGRVRQWRFFQEVQATNERLRVAAPMAFYLPPYFEYAAKEFGLSMPPAGRRAAHYGFALEPGVGSGERGASGPEVGWPHFKSGGLSFTPEDFGAEAVEPWMRRIGERIGEAEASPALAWLMEQAAGGPVDGRPEDRMIRMPEGRRGHFRSPPAPGPRFPSFVLPSSHPRPSVKSAVKSDSSDWLVRAEAPSPVVVDFVAGEGTLAVKNYNAYWLSGGPVAGRPEAGKPVAGGAEDGGVATPVSGVRIGPGSNGETPDTGVATQGAKVGRGVLVFYNFGAEPAELSWDWPEAIEPQAGRPEAGRPEGRMVGGPDEGRPETGGAEGGGPEDRGVATLVPSVSIGSKAPDTGAATVEAPATGDRRVGGSGAQRLTLAPGERREIAVELSVPDGEFAPAERRLAVEVCSGGAATVSRWATRVYPMPAGYLPAEERSFDFAPEAAAKNRAWLQARPHAAEEPRLRPAGAWLTTPGVRVEETATGWRLHVEALPDLSLRPARAELPLPDDWAPWETGLMLSYDYRIAPASFALRTPLRADDPDVTRRLQTGKIGDLIETYLRTETGNLYSTQPRLLPTPEWKRYNQTAETLTPHFPGRLAAPLRVGEERPASLVFFLRPAGLPTVFEIENPRLAHWRLGD